MRIVSLAQSGSGDEVGSRVVGLEWKLVGLELC